MFGFLFRKPRNTLDDLVVQIAEGHDQIIRTIKEARMSIETDLSDLAAEVQATKSAEAAATTAFNGVVQQLQAIQKQNVGNPTAYAAQIEQFTAALSASRGDMSAAITANTPSAGVADPSAPAPAVSAASGAGGNTFGSNGPSDTPNSAGDAGWHDHQRLGVAHHDEPLAGCRGLGVQRHLRWGPVRRAGCPGRVEHGHGSADQRVDQLRVGAQRQRRVDGRCDRVHRLRIRRQRVDGQHGLDRQHRQVRILTR